MTDQAVLVTGGAGFIRSHLVDRLVARGRRAYGPRQSLSNPYTGARSSSAGSSSECLRATTPRTTMEVHRPQPVAILSPHFDDAVLSCWNVLTGEARPTVVNVFTGPPDSDAPLSAWDKLTGARNPRERQLERRHEDREVLRALGYEPINLSFLDLQYRGGDQDSSPLLSELLGRLHRGSLVYAPAGIGGNPDHLTVRAAAVALLRRGFDVTLYGELPYSTHYGWPHWVTGADPDPYLDVTVDWAAQLAHTDVAVRPEDAVVVRLEPREIEAKLAAIRGYRTQYSGMRKLLSDEDSLRYEVCWPLERLSFTRTQALRYELLWRAGARRGSRIERLTRRKAFGLVRPSAGSRLGRLLRHRATRG